MARRTLNAPRSWSLAAPAMTMLFGVLLMVAVVLPAEAQFSSGSSGIHGAFPPVPEGQSSVPAVTYYMVWNIKTGTVRYCSAYDEATRLDQCSPGATTAVVAQIPNIPPGGLETGVYEFTNVDLTANRHVWVVGHTANTPLSILSQQDIKLFTDGNGFLNVSGTSATWVFNNNSNANFAFAGARGGPGGFDGGAGGNGGQNAGDGGAGFGPEGGAGGNAAATAAADFQGGNASPSPVNPALTPLSGGSGGGGAAGLAGNPSTNACAPYSPPAVGWGGGPGGGGGGGLLLAASGEVRLNGIIHANGGDGGRLQVVNQGQCLFGGGGAGGNVRIVATSFTGSAAGVINVQGGLQGAASPRAAGGVVRIEAASNTYSGSTTGASSGTFVQFPTAPIPTNQPSLRITAVGLETAPSVPSGSVATPDVTFSEAVLDPINVQLAASNVPLGTSINLRIVPAIGSATTATSSALVGSVGNSTANATITLPPGAGVITATATFSLGGGGGGAENRLLPNLPLLDGEPPAFAEVMATGDGLSKTFLVSRTGARFELGFASPSTR